MEVGRDEEMLLLDKNSKDIDWKDLDATKLYLNSCLFFLGLRAVLYPLSLIKTRLQAQKVRTPSSKFFVSNQLDKSIWLIAER